MPRKPSYSELQQRYSAAERSDTLNMLALHDVVNGRVEWAEPKQINGYIYQHGWSRLTAGHGGLLISKFTQTDRNYTSVHVEYLEHVRTGIDNEEGFYLARCVERAFVARNRAFDAERAA